MRRACAALLLAVHGDGPSFDGELAGFLARAGAPVFADPLRPLALELEADFGSLLISETGEALAPTLEGPGVLRLQSGGAVRALAVRVGVRGHSRRRACAMKPLWVQLDAEAPPELAPTRGKLELTTHCAAPAGAYAGVESRLVDREEAFHRALAALGAPAFRTQRLLVRYVDRAGGAAFPAGHVYARALLLESKGALRRRLGASPLEVRAEELGSRAERALANARRMAPLLAAGAFPLERMAALHLGQRLLLNTDYALERCVNVHCFVRPDGRVDAAAYDFDRAELGVTSASVEDHLRWFEEAPLGPRMLVRRAAGEDQARARALTRRWESEARALLERREAALAPLKEIQLEEEASPFFDALERFLREG